MENNAGKPAHADAPPKNKGGRPFGATTKIKLELRDWCRKSGKQAYENLVHLALHGEPDLVRLAATKEWIERAYGKVPANPDEGPGGVVTVSVITGVREDALPPPRPLLPDGRTARRRHCPTSRGHLD